MQDKAKPNAVTIGRFVTAWRVFFRFVLKHGFLF
jgi:hypothetical protein